MVGVLDANGALISSYINSNGIHPDTVTYASTGLTEREAMAQAIAKRLLVFLSPIRTASGQPQLLHRCTQGNHCSSKYSATKTKNAVFIAIQSKRMVALLHQLYECEHDVAERQGEHPPTVVALSR